MLREGVKFHDGSDFDSADVVDLLKRIKDPELASPVASVLSIMESVEAIDPLTVKITLSAPHADFPMLIMDYRIRMTPEGSGDTIGQTGIGTGPFILETLDPEGTTILKANPDYWEGAPGCPSSEFFGQKAA
jgi:peptide/nickel transport system substrate-binding protein